MKQIKFDFNNLLSFNIGKKHGITEKDLQFLSRYAQKKVSHFLNVIKNKKARVDLGLEWIALPFQDKKVISQIQKIGADIADNFENVIFLGIGGSFLGLKAAQDALLPVYYNEFAATQMKKPRVYFEGNNLDPETLSVLLKNLDPRKTFVVVISKSGETTETKAAFEVVIPWLKKSAGKHFGRQIFAITDPVSGTLRKKVEIEQEKDALSFRSLSLYKGVGGRFSEFNMGLLHLAIVGVDISEVLKGAEEMYKKCTQEEFFKNPALVYAALEYHLYLKKGKCISVLMPFSESLKSSADWYVQLLAESLGKKYARKIINPDSGQESWHQDRSVECFLGRTPIAARGTNDLHSIQQNNIEGENNKTVTFIKVEKFRNEIKLPGSRDILAGKTFSQLLALAQEATEWALVQENRPSSTIILPEISPYYWGALLFFFEMATAFEGELLDVNAYDQPGVEGYKSYMYYRLGKPGISQEASLAIKNNPLKKKKEFIL